MKKMNCIISCMIIICCLCVFWFLWSFEEIQYFVVSKRENIKYDYILGNKEKGVATFHLMKDSPDFVDRIFIFSGQEQIIEVQTGGVWIFPSRETLRIEFPGFGQLNRWEGFVFMHVSWSGLWSPIIIYFDDKDLFDFVPRFFINPYPNEIPDLTKTQFRSKYNSSCIAYIKGYQQNHTLSPECTQFIINDYGKDTLKIILNGEIGTRFKIIKVRDE